jgi:hypothetical protein
VPAECVETAAEEEDPGDKDEPGGIADGGGTTWNFVYPSFCDEQGGDIEDEGDKGNDACKA